MSPLGRVLLGLGGLLLAIGAVSGVMNREVLDGNRFASHVDGIRSDSSESREMGVVITEQLTRANPDLMVARPLLESTTSALVGSPATVPTWYPRAR